jgi:hypothetical protein
MLDARRRQSRRIQAQNANPARSVSAVASCARSDNATRAGLGALDFIPPRAVSAARRMVLSARPHGEGENRQEIDSPFQKWTRRRSSFACRLLGLVGSTVRFWESGALTGCSVVIGFLARHCSKESNLQPFYGQSKGRVPCALPVRLLPPAAIRSPARPIGPHPAGRQRIAADAGDRQTLTGG